MSARPPVSLVVAALLGVVVAALPIPSLPPDAQLALAIGAVVATFWVTGAVATSYGFALPVATPPNAIVLGTGTATRQQMFETGRLLDVVIGLTATVAIYLLAKFVWPLVL